MKTINPESAVRQRYVAGAKAAEANFVAQSITIRST